MLSRDAVMGGFLSFHVCPLTSKRGLSGYKKGGTFSFAYCFFLRMVVAQFFPDLSYLKTWSVFIV